MEPKALEMAIMVDEVRKGRFRVLATFKLLCAPFRIEGCRLVESAEGYNVWLPDRRTRCTQEGMAAIIGVAREAYERAIGGL